MDFNPPFPPVMGEALRNSAENPGEMQIIGRKQSARRARYIEQETADVDRARLNVQKPWHDEKALRPEIRGQVAEFMRRWQGGRRTGPIGAKTAMREF